MSVPQVQNPKSLHAPPHVEEILQKMFAGYRRVIIEKELGGGFSRSRILVVRPFKEQRAELPAVVKMASSPLIEKEKQAYQAYIRNRLPNTARIQESVYSADGAWAGLCYSLVGGGIFEIESLYQYLLRAEVDVKKVEFTLKERLFESMGLLWRANEARQGFQFQGSYDSVLPVNMIVASLDVTRTLPPSDRICQLTPETVAQRDFRADDYVSLLGFEVIEVEPYEAESDEQVVTLSRPRSADDQPNAYRLRLQLAQGQSPADYRVGGRLTKPVIGQIVTTRIEVLQQLAQQTVGNAIDLTLETIPLTLLRKTITLPNPLTAWSDILSRHFDVRVAHAIHGDLNLQNILVDPQTGDINLIDFADARQDHVLHDLLRLETEVVTHLLPLALNQAELSPTTIYTFYTQLHCATFQAAFLKPVWVPAHLEKPFAVLKAIRQTARHYLFNYDDCAEYYQGLTIYLLGALKFRNLDRWAKQVAFWGAATVQELLAAPPQAETDCGQEEMEPGRWGLKALISKLLRDYTDRLQALNAREVRSGQEMPAEVLRDMFELGVEIDKLQEELQKIEDRLDSAPPAKTNEIRSIREITQRTERYRLERRIGAGGMGEVWQAMDTLLDRPVAIKYMQASDDLISKEQFLTEARMLASLNHPNITAIHDAVFDESNNTFYLVMEYVDGKPLSAIIEENDPLPLDVILDIAMGILRALSYAHNRGIVHRDIKPANVLVKDEIKLTDFGLANLMSLLKQGTNLRVGTPDYVAPEQIEGRPTDGRADLYSLGVLLFTMITGGHLPFDAQNEQALLRAHLHDPPIPVSEFSPNVPPILEHTIMRLLAKDPEERYPSADALLNVLNSIHARQKYSHPHLQLLDHDSKPLVGRAAELNKLEAAWNEVGASGQPHLLVVRGEMGVGKSRLVAEFLGDSIIDKGFVGLVGRCDEFRAPYTPFAEILATIFNTRSVRSQIVDQELGQILAQIPGLTALFTIDTVTPAKEIPRDPKQAQWLFFEAMAGVLAKLGPAVIFLEDAAFLDEASIALTRYLIRHGRYLPLLLIAACRDEGGSIPWFSSFRADEQEVIALQPLSVASIKEYLTHLMDGPVSDAVVSTVHKRTDGIPFYIKTITDLLIEAGDFYRSESGEWQYTATKKTAPLPPTLENIFAQRLEKLTKTSHQALAVAANIGPEFDFDAWAAVLGGEDKVPFALDVLDEALGTGILRDAGNNHYIFHPIDIAKTLTSSLTASRQRHLHRQIGDALRDKGSPSLIAHHYQLAGLISEAIRYLEVAGAKAMSANAVNQAIDYYNQAVALGGSQESYEVLGNLYRQKGAWKESFRAYGQALALAKQAGDISDQARILNGMALVLAMFDHYHEADEAAGTVLKLSNIPEIERAKAQSNLGLVSWYSGRLMEAEYWCEVAVETLTTIGDKASLGEAYNRLGLAHYARSNLSRAEVMFKQSLKIRRKLNDYWGQAYCLNNLGKVATNQGDFDQAHAYFDSAQQLFEKIESDDGLMVVYTNRGQAWLALGQVDKASAILAQALDQAKKLSQPSSYVLGRIYLLVAQANLQRGDLTEARSATDEALKLVEAAGNQKHIATAQAILAQIQAAEGDPSSAESLYQKGLSLFEQVGSREGWLRTQLLYAQFLIEQGRVEEATGMEQTARAEAAKLGLHL